jgi:hypothetical protein
MANKTWLGNDSGNEGDWATAANWSPAVVPTTGDDVRLVADYNNAVTAGLDQSAVAVGDVIVEEGFTSAIGTATAELQIDPNRFEFSGSGTSYIDLGSAAIPAQILGTANADSGKRGLYLFGSALTIVNVEAGSVGLASRHGDTGTITTVRINGSGADLWLGEGLTLTTLDILAGVAALRCGATTVNIYGGELTTAEVAAITTLTIHGGEAVLNATGTVTTLNHEGGTVELTQSGATRTITTYNPQNGATLHRNPAVTFTTFNLPTAAGDIIFSG